MTLVPSLLLPEIPYLQLTEDKLDIYHLTDLLSDT